MAVANGTVAGRALFYALLAFSSLHRSRYSQQAVQLKISALHNLSASANEEPLTLAEAAQRVAASMLLGAFDILLPSTSSGEWLWHTQGAMDIVQSTGLKDQLFESGIGHLLNWVYYHDTLSRFPLRHWQHESLARQCSEKPCSDSQDVQHLPLLRHRPAPPSPNPSYAILNLLSETCGTLLEPWDPRSRSAEYRDRLQALEGRVGNVHRKPGVSVSSGPDAELAVDVWQTATRVYLVRASQSVWDKPASLDSLVDWAFAGPIRTCSCPHFFPLFILACEARTDERRTAILNLIDRNSLRDAGRSKTWLRDIIQPIWAHQDLHEDSDLLVNYVGAMNATISSTNSVPSFV
ncbi:hypothetical protein QQS21_001978 [Conoideocrella luteorostrata]|uniref:Uncharacterized protein n=1 Tax=Conoideocrella luteorostrata TaxID=1105319 RepID=A0AAJ0FXR0_9HYPO|nr:hypothetical protein QQS21_001978 [Conoideocrella luteorostrata]